MRVSQWAEIRRLAEVDRLSQRQIAERLRCCWRTVKKALTLEQPPDETRRAPRGSILDPHKPKIDALIDKYPDLSAVRVFEEIRKGPEAYRGEISVVRSYLRQIRPLRQRIYQEVFYEPGQALQVDWGSCGHVQLGSTQRRVSVFVAVLCYSRLCYIEFCLSERKAEFYRCLVQALKFFGGSPRQIIFDNLKAAVLNGSGKHACLHPDFLALCGHFYLQPIACARRDPESKGVVEAKVRYVKRNALQGRDEELACWEGYGRLASYWRDQVANVRVHDSTRERPVDRFQKEQGLLRPLPAAPFNTDEMVPVVVNSHARVNFDGNRYSVPPELARKTALLRATPSEVRVLYQGRPLACHPRSYDRGQLIRHPDHELAALQMRRRVRATEVENHFDALGEEARKFHLELRRRPLKTSVHLRRLLKLVPLYGRQEVVAAIVRAHEYQTYDAAYVETILLQERRRRELPSPLTPCPKRRELIEDIHLEEPDPAVYDRLCNPGEETPGPTVSPVSTSNSCNFDFPKRIPKQKILRLFDCEFVSQHHSAILIGRTGTGKTHLLNALAYTACEKGISVRWTRASDMLHVLTTAQINGTLEKKLRQYTRPQLLLLDELGYLPIDKRGGPTAATRSTS